MTDTSTITLGDRHHRTRRVLLRIGTNGVWWGNGPSEDAGCHDRISGRGFGATTIARHTALAVIRRALDTAEAAGVDIESSALAANLGGWRYCLAHDECATDNLGLSARVRANRYLVHEVRAALDDPAALAALPYDVRDHRTPTPTADNPHCSDCTDDDPCSACEDQHATATGERPPITSADVSRGFERLEATLRNGVRAYWGDGTPVGTPRPPRTFPPASDPADTPEERARKLLEYHTPRPVDGGCYCGWVLWGASFAGHLVATLDAAGLLHGTRQHDEVARLERERDDLRAMRLRAREQRDDAREEARSLSEDAEPAPKPVDAGVSGAGDQPTPQPSPLTVALAENINATLSLWVEQLNAATARTNTARAALNAATTPAEETAP